MSQQNLTETFYREHHSWLQMWLRSKLGNRYDAADLAHDTFVLLLSKQEKFFYKPVEKPRAFLRVIARGLLIDHLRRHSLEQVYLEALANLPEPLIISPEEQEILLETLHRIDAMLDRLPYHIRYIFMLSQIHGFTYDEIAEQMNLSVRTIKRYMQLGFSQCIAAMF